MKGRGVGRRSGLPADIRPRHPRLRPRSTTESAHVDPFERARNSLPRTSRADRIMRKVGRVTPRWIKTRMQPGEANTASQATLVASAQLGLNSRQFTRNRPHPSQPAAQLYRLGHPHSPKDQTSEAPSRIDSEV